MKKIFTINFIIQLASIILSVIGLAIIIYNRIVQITNFPLNIFWSESGRIFNAYQIYAPIISGDQYPLPWLDPTRAILDGLVLLIPGLQLWMWRFWISFLSIMTSFMASFFIIRQADDFKTKKVFGKQFLNKYAIFILFGTLFLFQGPIYSHLLIGVIPILALYDNKKLKRILPVIIFSSLWMGLTRANWFLMPALIAITFYVIKTRKNDRPLFSYLRLPIIWFMTNLFFSIGVYFMSIQFSGRPSILSPAMDYGFFRYKLFSNIGFPLGLLPGIALISLPLATIIFIFFWTHIHQIRFVRILILILNLAILGLGSTLVSLRSGGGYDLHNYDTYILMLFILGLHILFGSFSLERSSNDIKKLAIINNYSINYHAITFFLLIIPVIMQINFISARPIYDTELANQVISEISEILEDEKYQTDDPILFIDFRHLVVFDFLPNQEVYYPYEKIELMEMAMANNNNYFDQFIGDVQSKKFQLILSTDLNRVEKSLNDYDFWYENNVWVNYVSNPLLNNYQPLYTNEELMISIYHPKK